jgi:selenocysteine lyase/cysteine desulfurase
MEQVQDVPKVHTHTSLDPRFSCVIGLVSVDGLKTGDFVSKLFSQYKIHTTGIDWEGVAGVRVTPHVYTQTRDLDKLVRAIKEIAATV